MQYTALMDYPETTESDFAALVGIRVRDARVSADLTLEQLAAASGVSRRTIISIEQGKTNASIAVLLRISTALGVGLASFVKDASPENLGVLRSGAVHASWLGISGGQAKLVASTDSPEIFELWDWTLGVGDIHHSEAHSAGTHELLFVIGGSLTLTVAGTTQTLNAGDSASYAGVTEHSYANRGSTPARFSLAVLQPHLRSTSDA